ncbi:MAG: GNAT family N-acetyltransferase [Alphaproteobacteria bacterium]|nr:GNAT family N-acetyltransferase [Alphaproteobacteria bacterium]
MSAPALRPMLPSDAHTVAEIFRASIEGLAGEDYNPAQQEAWMSAADDEAAFAGRREKELTLIATLDRVPAGFVSLKDSDHIEMLYVHPRAARRGVAKALVGALETLAAARGITRLTVDASDTARGFFAKRGYVAQRRNTVEINGEWLGNTSMEKTLQPVNKGPLQ